MKFDVKIKSGTCGYFDYDNCDAVLETNIDTEQLPKRGEKLILWGSETGNVDYYVTDVTRSFHRDEHKQWREYNTVYVIKM